MIRGVPQRVLPARRARLRPGRDPAAAVTRLPRTERGHCLLGHVSEREAINEHLPGVLGQARRLTYSAVCRVSGHRCTAVCRYSSASAAIWQRRQAGTPLASNTAAGRARQSAHSVPRGGLAGDLLMITPSSAAARLGLSG